MSEQPDPRVLFAAERTLLAWNRTSITLIAFGFIVERSGLLIKALSVTELSPVSMMLTTAIGLVFIVAGSFVALYSSKQYANVLKTLNPADFPIGYSAKWGIAVNFCVAVLGIVLSLSLLLVQ